MPTLPAARLYSALSVDAAWESMIRPWLEKATGAIGGGILVVPTRGLATAIKNRALQAGLSLLGVRFWLPADVRRMLVGEPANRQALRLVTAVIAEEMELRADHATERQVASAIARAPESFLRAFDQLEQAGWNPLEHLPPVLRTMARTFAERTARAGFYRAATLDREIRSRAKVDPPELSRLLIAGFDGAHWVHLSLLMAAARLAEEAEVVLTEPRDEARALDAIWIGTWEQEFSPAQPVAGEDRPRPMTGLLQLPHSKKESAERSDHPAECLDFLVGETAAELAKMIALRVLQALIECESPRIAVVFPRASALSRLVSLRLADAGILHNDALGHPLADDTEDPAWTAWLRLQDDHRVGPFIEFLEECGTVPRLSNVGASSVAHRLRKELADLLIDDLPVLAESLASREGEVLAPSIAAGLRELIWLPERAAVTEMFAATVRAFVQLGWNRKAVDLRSAAAAWIGGVSGSISRTFWLRWIGEALAFSERQRAVEGRHPYARVHLTALADAAPLEWTHVILGGLNEEAWPLNPDEDGWLSEPEVAGLNAQARRLNAGVVRQGRQGEGHEALHPDHAWCLTSGDVRAILQRQFFNLLENASIAVTATATIRSPESPERVSQPGEFFGRLYYCARGRAISPAIMLALRADSDRWLASSGRWLPAAEPLDEVKETLAAWTIRRKDGCEFGEYEFALKIPPELPVSLAATKWEGALRSPAHVFMDVFLNVLEPEDADPDFTARAIGTWVHRWLAQIGGGFRDGVFRSLAHAAELEKIVRASALADRDRVSSLLGRVGRSVPDWWAAIWKEAFSTALALVRKIPAGAGWTHCATEFSLGPLSMEFPEGKALRVSGQIDLLLAQSAPDKSRLPGGLVWIVDYKTGDPKALKAEGLAKGDGLQLGLYGLAAKVLGAEDVHLSRVGRSLDLAGSQMNARDLAGLESLWNALIAMQETGRFGMLGAIRSPYGVHATYPLATLGIDEALLQSKWAHTHVHLSPNDAD